MMLRFACVLLLFAAPAAAQDPRIGARFPAAVAARLDSVIESAAREGLPREPLVLRALEGGAKNAPPAVIIGVVERLHVALRAARTVLGTGTDAVELATAAAAIQAGVPEERLVELHTLRAGMSVTAPLGAYLDLVSRGAAADRAWDRVAELARRQARDAEFIKLKPEDLDHKLPAPPRPRGGLPGRDHQ